MGVVVRGMETAEWNACERVLRALPAWFGIEQSIVDYVDDIRSMDTYVATDDRVVGFVTIGRPTESAAEIQVMGVLPEFHGRGIGRALVEYAEERLRETSCDYLQVKTLGPSRPNSDYEKTRGFYQRLGFRPLEENKLWGEVNPCLILVKSLAGSGSVDAGSDVTAMWRTGTWRQFGAAIDMLENAIRGCPDDVWLDSERLPWYWTYHTLFWMDLYLSGAVDGFHPPAPFGLEELDPRGVLPPRAYSQDELLTYLAHCREKCRGKLATLTQQEALRRCTFGWGEPSVFELLLYNLRHVQHGAAQLNLILRQRTDSAPRWVGRTKSDLSCRS